MSLGKSLLRSKQTENTKRKQKYAEILDQHSRAVDEEEKKNAQSLKSVWNTSNMQDFFDEADAKEGAYQAERGVRVVVSGAVHIVKNDRVVPLSDNSKNWIALSERLTIPHRPPWDYKTTAKEIDYRERQAFLDWRRGLAQAEESEKVVMTPYEKNLEVWRQLWRVVERSDIVLYICDARNPLVFRSVDFEQYVQQHKTRTGKTKRVILLLNKSDYLTESQRKAWAQYLTQQKVEFMFFSALEREKPPTAEDQADSSSEEDDEEGSEYDEDEDEELEEDAVEVTKDSLKSKTALQNAHEIHNNAKSSRRLKKRLRGAPTKLTAYPQQKTPAQIQAEMHAAELEAARLKAAQPTEEMLQRDARLNAAGEPEKVHEPWHVLEPEELLDRLAFLRKSVGLEVASNAYLSAKQKAEAAAAAPMPKGKKGKGEVAEEKPIYAQNLNSTDSKILIGMVGYPNVGKSSTINALIGCKKVVVSQTPGKTKHFQTLSIPNEHRVMLCDCPGLVFPSFASTRETMVCDGILPIDNVRDFISPIAVVCRRIPRPVLEYKYRIHIDKSEDQDESSSIADMVLNLVARRRGYLADHGRPNRARAAKELLKDYTDGRLLFVHPPPDGKVPPPPPEVTTILQQIAAYREGRREMMQALEEEELKREAAERLEAEEAGDDEPSSSAKQQRWAREKEEEKTKKVSFKAAPTADDDDDYEDVDDEGEEDWEDISGAEGERNLSDDDDESDDPEFAAEEARASLQEMANLLPVFLDRRADVGSSSTRLTESESFNIESNAKVITEAAREKALAAQDAEAAKFFGADLNAPNEFRGKQRKKKSNPQVDDLRDMAVRINRRGEKEVLIDSDDDIVCLEDEGEDDAAEVDALGRRVGSTKKEKQKSKKQQRREAKKAGATLPSNPTKKVVAVQGKV